MCFTLFLFATINFFGQSAKCKLTITPLENNFYIYTTDGDAGYGTLFPANGMYLITDSGAVLFDTPWDSTQFQPLLDSIKLKHKKKVIICLATHFHEDRTAGLSYLRQSGVKTFTTKLTDSLSEVHKNPRAEFLLLQDTVFKVGQYSFETYYPGEGHSPDNIIVWFNKERILYGACFIKSTETNSLGNLSDVNINEWIISADKVKEKCKRPKFIIPGHQSWQSKKSLTHTLNMLHKTKDNKKK